MILDKHTVEQNQNALLDQLTQKLASLTKEKLKNTFELAIKIYSKPIVGNNPTLFVSAHLVTLGLSTAVTVGAKTTNYFIRLQNAKNRAPTPEELDELSPQSLLLSFLENEGGMDVYSFKYTVLEVLFEIERRHTRESATREFYIENTNDIQEVNRLAIIFIYLVKQATRNVLRQQAALVFNTMVVVPPENTLRAQVQSIRQLVSNNASSESTHNAVNPASSKINRFIRKRELGVKSLPNETTLEFTMNTKDVIRKIDTILQTVTLDKMVESFHRAVKNYETKLPNLENSLSLFGKGNVKPKLYRYLEMAGPSDGIEITSCPTLLNQFLTIDDRTDFKSINYLFLSELVSIQVPFRFPQKNASDSVDFVLDPEKANENSKVFIELFKTRLAFTLRSLTTVKPDLGIYQKQEATDNSTFKL